jgi:predicted kinase
MSTGPRSVKIGENERTGWSSERPRREGSGPPRKVDISVRGRVLAPTDRMRYSPGSLVIVLGPPAAKPGAFAERVVEERGAVLSLGKVRELLAGRMPEEQIAEKAPELLEAAAAKRFAAGSSVVIATEDLSPEERERYARLAHGHGRPRHLVLLDPPTDQVGEDEKPALDALRRTLNAGEAGAEGFHTALRLGGGAIGELKRIVFRPPPRDD